MRAVIPGWEANMWVKWLRRIKVGDQPWHHREETSKYTDLLENGKARRFTFVMDAKSVITSPCRRRRSTTSPASRCCRARLVRPRQGRARRCLARWRAQLADRAARRSGLDKALTRFYYEFDWDGRELLLQSRAMDETGYVQPTKAELRKVRGVNSIYHNNGIQTWHVLKNGEVENVEVLSAARRVALLAAPGDRASRGQAPAAHAQAPHAPKKLGIGREATPEEIAGWDIDVRPDGQGLPPGKGTVKAGRRRFIWNAAPPAMASSARAPGAGRLSPAATARSRATTLSRSVGSYWPYASTVFDYIRRAMPFGNSQSLTNDELYAVTAYVLFLNDIVN